MKKYTIRELTYGSQAVAEVKLTYSSNITPENRRYAGDSDSVVDVLLEFWDRETIELQETFVVLFLDRQNRVIGIYEHARGATNAVHFDPKLVMAAAVKCRAESIVLAHNHPSGTLGPSMADITVTKRFGTLAKLMGMSLYDHIIVTPHGGYYSFGTSMPDVLLGHQLS